MHIKNKICKSLAYVVGCLGLYLSSTGSNAADSSGEYKSALNCIRQFEIMKFVDSRVSKFSNNEYLIEFNRKVDVDKLDYAISKCERHPNNWRGLVKYLYLTLNDFYEEVVISKVKSEYRNGIEFEMLPVINGAVISFHETNSVNRDVELLRHLVGEELSVAETNSFRDLIFDNLQEKYKDGVFDKESEKPNLVIGILGSGITTNHKSLIELRDVKQYNPKEKDDRLVDTGLGHDTGILSILAGGADELGGQRPLGDIGYRACNGLPNGRFDELLILKCVDWYFQMVEVPGVILNPWASPKKTCHFRIVEAMRVLWRSGSIPIFSAGNFGDQTDSSYTAISFFIEKDIPVITVGASNDAGEPLEFSSYGVSACDTDLDYPILFSRGKDITVANPIDFDSFQLVAGTSYSIAYIASDVFQLMKLFPHLPVNTLITELLATSRRKTTESRQSRVVISHVDMAAAVARLQVYQNVSH